MYVDIYSLTKEQFHFIHFFGIIINMISENEGRRGEFHVIRRFEPRLQAPLAKTFRSLSGLYATRLRRDFDISSTLRRPSSSLEKLVRNLRVWWAKHCQFYEHFISF